jgi:hypothetical protein
MAFRDSGLCRDDDPLCQNENAWPLDDHGLFVYVPLGWRTEQRPGDGDSLSRLYVENALQELHALYATLPVPDRLLDLVRRGGCQA